LPTKVAADEKLAKRLTAAGSTAIALEPRDEFDPRFVLPATVSREKLVFVLDTGAAMSLLNANAAKRCDLKAITDTAVAVNTELGEIRLHERLLPAFALGTHKVAGGRILSGELDGLLMNERRDTRQLDGLVGQPIFDEGNAVIDCGTRTLYLSDPLEREWPRLRGEWVCVRGQRDGVEVADPRKWSLAFSERGTVGIRHQDPKKAGDATVSILNDAGQPLLAVGGKSNDVPLFEQVGSLARYAIRGNRLSLCYSLPEAGAKLRVSARVPVKFESDRGSGCAELEFERVGKGPPELEPVVVF